MMSRNVTNIEDKQDENVKRRILQKNFSKASSMQRYPSSNLSSSNENILIMSVLKKLESLTEPKNPFQE